MCCFEFHSLFINSLTLHLSLSVSLPFIQHEYTFANIVKQFVNCFFFLSASLKMWFLTTANLHVIQAWAKWAESCCSISPPYLILNRLIWFQIAFVMHEVEADSKANIKNLMKMAESDWIRSMSFVKMILLCPSSVLFTARMHFKSKQFILFYFVVFHIFRCGLIYVHASIHRNIDGNFSQVFYTSV